MSSIILYHGSPNKVVLPKYGEGDEKHDYGKGFYLTESIALAKEWAVCKPNDTNGWVHECQLDVTNLKILDFTEHGILAHGGLGVQYCVKSERAYSALSEIASGLTCVDYAEFNGKYNQRDITAREKMHRLIDSDANKVQNVFSELIKGEQNESLF